MRQKDYTPRANTQNTYGLTRRIIDPDAEKGYRFEINFPSVFKDSNLAFIRAYDVLHSHYMETRVTIDGKDQPVLRPVDYGIYCDLLFAAERSERYNHDDLAWRRGLDKEALRDVLDRLEDLRLIIRVKGYGRGHPTHLLVCAPFEPGKHAERRKDSTEAPQYFPGEVDAQMPYLCARLTSHHTANRRAALPRRAFPDVRWDADTFRKATVSADFAREFHAVCTITADLIYALNQAGRTLTRAALMTEVRRLCRNRRVLYSRKMFDSAMFNQHIKTFAASVAD